MEVLRRTRYVNKEELLSMLDAETKTDAIRSVIDKEFAPRIIKHFETSPTMIEAYNEIDKYHSLILREIVEKSGYHSVTAIVDGITQAYSLIVLLMTHQAGLEPVTYIPLADLESCREIIVSGRVDGHLSPFVRGMVARYYSHKHLRESDVLRVFDELRLILLRRGSYRERIITGLYFDGIMMRLCAFEEFSELHFRTVLFESRDFESLRATIRVNIEAIIDVMKRAHPLLTLFSEILRDCLNMTHGLEVLDLVSVMAPAYVSALTLHAHKHESRLLKQYFLFLRQAILLKLILTHIEDAIVKDSLKTIIERWVIP
ncbi:MAG: hypothetical protein QW794_02410 [Thermosphaera sp.]